MSSKISEPKNILLFQYFFIVFFESVVNFEAEEENREDQDRPLAVNLDEEAVKAVKRLMAWAIQAAPNLKVRRKIRSFFSFPDFYHF